MNLMPGTLAKAYKRKDIDALRKYNVMTCMNCGSCAYNCPARIQLNFLIAQAKNLVIEDDKKQKAKAEAEAAKKAEGGEKQ